MLRLGAFILSQRRRGSIRKTLPATLLYRPEFSSTDGKFTKDSCAILDH
jgi:hypothetical protein